MTRRQDSAGVRRWSEEIRKALSEDRDLLKTIVEKTLQQVLEERPVYPIPFCGT